MIRMSLCTWRVSHPMLFVLFPCAEETLGAGAVGRWLVMLVVLGSVSKGPAELRIGTESKDEPWLHANFIHLLSKLRNSQVLLCIRPYISKKFSSTSSPTSNRRYVFVNILWITFWKQLKHSFML